MCDLECDQDLLASIPRYFYSQVVLDAANASHTLDFVGANYYTVTTIGLSDTFPFVVEVPCANCSHDDMGTEIHPEGILLAARDLHARYHLPIVFTENGLADAVDSRRPAYLRDHLQCVPSHPSPPHPNPCSQREVSR